MPFTHAPYTDSNLEFWEIHDLLTEAYAALGHFLGWSFCRSETWRYRVHAERQAQDPGYLCGLAEVWRDASGKLVALAISENGGDDIHVLTRLNWCQNETHRQFPLKTGESCLESGQ